MAVAVDWAYFQRSGGHASIGGPAYSAGRSAAGALICPGQLPQPREAVVSPRPLTRAVVGADNSGW